MRASFLRCCQQDDFIDIFYFELTTRAPETGRMFAGTKMSTQDTLVRSGISYLIEFAAGVPGVRSKIDEIGRKHDRNHLQVRPDLYPAWVDSLVAAVRECDAHADDGLCAAWRQVVEPGVQLIAAAY